MPSAEPFCELCELPLSQCVHGMPPPPPAEPKPAPKPRKRATPAARPAAVERKPVVRRWTPPETLKPVILKVLQDAEGELEADDLFAALEAELGDRLLPGDLETTPEGELRWRYAARRARLALIQEGRMTKDVPGVWTLGASARQA